MKRLITILLFLITYNAISQIKPIFEFEFGYKKQSNSMSVHTVGTLAKYGDNMHKSPLYSDIKVGFNYNNIYFYQNIQNYFGMNNITNYKPYQIVYITTLEYKYQRVSLMYEHMCNHPITGDPLYMAFDNYLRQSSDKFSLKIIIL